MVAAAAWNQASVRNEHDPDLWHVAIAPGDTKILSLEQLDDLFRLDIIDASTRVWQPGMSEWLPLSVVAGLEDEQPTAIRPPPPPPSSRSAPARPPAPPPSRPLPYAATVPVAAAAQPIWALPAAAPVAAAPVFAAPESLRPLVLSDVPVPAQRGGGAGRFLVGLALVASVGITLYRNDVLRNAARSAGREPAYLRLESALGSPGFGTPRSVEQLMASSLALPEPGDLTAAPETTPARAVATPAAAPAAETTPAASPAPAREESAKVEVASTKPASLESLVAAQVGATRRQAEPAAPARSRPRAATPSSAPAPEKSLGIKGSSHRFDPLNGKL